MARLEFITYSPFRERAATTNDEDIWERDLLGRTIERFPQIYWRSGEGWFEVNHWALVRVLEDGVKLDTVTSLMKHLYSFANYVEDCGVDWLYFPVRKDERVLYKFRGHLMAQIEAGQIKSSTAKARINAVVRFYRHAHHFGFISPKRPLWDEKQVVHTFVDTVGFKRSMLATVTDLSIKNNRRHGLVLEDGLLPLSEDHMAELLRFSNEYGVEEIHRMLEIGFFTGARIGTITTLKTENIDSARPDPHMPGFYLIRVGPGTGVATKFDVEGDLLVPGFLLDRMREYEKSVSRFKREIRAAESSKSSLFLTRRGNPFSVETVDRLINKLRKVGFDRGLKFLERFKFHQTRATYGTWLLEISLELTDVGSAVGFLMEAMLHKDEATSLGYVKFRERSKAKRAVSAAFYEAFTGLNSRQWGDHPA